jgi:hypothetical protein
VATPDDEFIDAEIVEPDHLPAVVDPLPATYRPTLVLEPGAARDLVTQIKTVQREVLVPKVDYDVLPGMKRDAAPILLKPGAERLLQVFGLGHTMERIEVDPDPDGGHWGVWYRCTVTKVLLDGREIVVSSCEAHASYDEDKFWDGIYEGKYPNRKKVGQKKSPWNTVIKMAQKRALVGATLTATATSGLFTQDMEDYYHEHPREEPEPSHRPPVDPEAPVTRAQITKIQTMFGKLGIDDRDAKLAICQAIVSRELGSSKDLTMGEAHQVIEELERREREG